jgi:protoporphyrinogen oxidase
MREELVVRKTQQELQQARKAAQAEREAEEQERQKRLNWLFEAKERHAQLVSVADGLYNELDKLARKWPSMPVTERQVTKVNRLLGAVRQLLEDEGDEFADALDEVVPAGDMPETRDIVLILREARDALDRFESKYESEWRTVHRADG